MGKCNTEVMSWAKIRWVPTDRGRRNRLRQFMNKNKYNQDLVKEWSKIDNFKIKNDKYI